MIRALTIFMLTITIPGLASGADLEREARELEAMLIAPCCFRQQVSGHQSEGSFNNSLCSICGEYVFERYVHLKSGKPVCIPCSGYLR